ncbi:MAG: OmpH family outer membrane protein [Spirochaetia bacterium]|nr:OmpH family outer membrane protein [Spirochaetia bacterium]
MFPIFFAALPSPLSAAATPDKDVAFVDMRRIFDFYVRAQNVETGIREIQNGALAEAGRKRKRIDDLRERLRKELERIGSAGIPDEATRTKLDNMSEEIRFQEDELAQFLGSKKNEIKLEEKKISRSLLRSILDQVKKIAAQERYYLVLDKSEYALYVSTRADITDKVIRNLERERDLFKVK